QMNSSTLDGPGTIDIPAGQTLYLNSSTSNADLVNEGLIVNRGSSTLNAGVSNRNGATLRIAEGDGDSRLTAAHGFTNDGTIELTDLAGSYYGFYTAQLSVVDG